MRTVSLRKILITDKCTMALKKGGKKASLSGWIGTGALEVAVYIKLCPKLCQIIMNVRNYVRRALQSNAPTFDCSSPMASTPISPIQSGYIMMSQYLIGLRAGLY